MLIILHIIDLIFALMTVRTTREVSKAVQGKHTEINRKEGMILAAILLASIPITFLFIVFEDDMTKLLQKASSALLGVVAIIVVLSVIFVFFKTRKRSTTKD